MRIHSDHISSLEVHKAATVAGVDFTRFNEHGSRSRDHAFDVILTGSSPRRQNGGTDKAATWDEWGVFLGLLFAVDPRMVTPYYESAAHFDWATGGQYRNGASPVRHKSHRWEWAGHAATGNYHMSECQCGAVRRFLMGRTWAEFERAVA